MYRDTRRAVIERGPMHRGKHPLLSDRRNIVVVGGEAHSSQYDFIDGFAKHMRDALPKASFIGFTGTPIESGDKNTQAVFGDYIDVYDILQSKEDKATVPIHYEARLAKIDLKPEDARRLARTLSHQNAHPSGGFENGALSSSITAMACSRLNSWRATCGRPKAPCQGNRSHEPGAPVSDPAHRMHRLLPGRRSALHSSVQLRAHGLETVEASQEVNTQPSLNAGPLLGGAGVGFAGSAFLFTTRNKFLSVLIPEEADHSVQPHGAWKASAFSFCGFGITKLRMTMRSVRGRIEAWIRAKERER
jgi:hypothetical protein